MSSLFPSTIPEHHVNALYNIGDALWGIAAALVLLCITIAFSVYRLDKRSPERCK